MKEIKDFPGYFVMEDGRVFSAWKRNGIKSYLNYDNLKELKPYKAKVGYLVVDLYENKTRSNKKVHRLVAETYIQNPNNLPQVNHIDEDKSNNCVSNLEWVTDKQNKVHSKCRWIYQIENIITGEIIETINATEFAKNNKLDHKSLLLTIDGKRNQHKNYKIISRTQFK